MPTPEDYQDLAPFTLDELVRAANSVLSDDPSLRVLPRTIRYHIAKGLLPPPSGPPRYARYGYEHLVKVVQIRRDQSRGKGASEVGLGDRGAKQSMASPAEQSAKPDQSVNAYVPAGGEGFKATQVLRVPLNPAVTLEVSCEVDLQEALEDCLVEVRRLLRSMPEIT